eukprot:CAMPEP_0196667644 /NCGR_PEP_ID=MMETSP1086-20130531/65195_1 /TAXON_ID=77921 /ORGANISM="Cyanoptyche  gloeocystis , Strain SAG4.97" /LENGTH=460 /DNA_ID=CAMNT_0042004993 /DNA_START=232 /DNA_END=1614 /DNA_ORIENTATION=-
MELPSFHKMQIKNDSETNIDDGGKRRKVPKGNPNLKAGEQKRTISKGKRSPVNAESIESDSATASEPLPERNAQVSADPDLSSAQYISPVDASGSGLRSDSGSDADPSADASDAALQRQQQQAVSDWMATWKVRDVDYKLNRLVRVFLTRQPQYWFALAALSGNWRGVAQPLVDFVRRKLDEEGDDMEGWQRDLLEELAQRAPQFSAELEACSSLLRRFVESPEYAWEKLVRDEFDALTDDFFAYLQCAMENAADDQVRAQLADAFPTLLQLYAREQARRQVEQVASLNALRRMHNANADEATVVQPGSVEATFSSGPEKALDQVARLYRQVDARGLELPRELQIVQFLIGMKSSVARRLALHDIFQTEADLGDLMDVTLQGMHAEPQALLDAVDVLIGSYEKHRDVGTVRKVLESSDLIDSLQALRCDILGLVTSPDELNAPPVDLHEAERIAMPDETL